MRFTRILALPAVLAALFLTLYAGQSLGADDSAAPAPLAQDARPLSQVAQVEMPAVDNEAEIARELLRQAPGGAPRYAVPLATRISPDTHGTMETMENGLRLWRLRVRAPKAVSINLGFTTYQMPEGGRLFIYTPDYSEIRGPFTAADNEVHGELWTPLLFGDEQVIEVQLPARQWDEVQLELTAVLHGFIELGQAPESGSCNVDVVCPEGDGWRDEIRSVAVIGTGGGTFCTGFLVNNTAQDLTPYFMTADHCGIGPGNAASLVAYWNYENSTCRPPGSAASGGPGDGTLDQFNTGSIFRAGYGPSDFTLVELDDPIPSEYNVHWAGWDATSDDATMAVAIHHPNTDEKRISFENEPTTTTSYLGNTSPGDGTHVRVEDWDVGTTEPGSSGSPLFNQDQRIIGQLHGGFAACGNDDPDWYGRMSVSWTGGGTVDSSLQTWLDPLSTGQLTLDGRDESSAPDFTFVVDPLEQAVCAPDSAVYSVQVTSINNFSDTVSLALDNGTLPLGTSSVTPSSAAAPYTSTVTLEPSDANTPGRYDVVLVGTAPTTTHTTTLGLDLYTAVPTGVVLETPADGAANVPGSVTFQWSAGTQSGEYQLEVARDAAFNDVVIDVVLGENSYTPETPLNPTTPYYWRVTPGNACGQASATAAFTFTTAAVAGTCAPGSMPFTAAFEDFEGGAAGWSTGGTGSTWALVTNDPYSGSFAYHAEDVPSVSDQYLISPPYTVPETAFGPLSLQFWNRQAIEDSSSGCFDGAMVEISTDDGATWTQLENNLLVTDPYDGVIDSGFENPAAGQEAWCGDPQDWLNSIVDIGAYAGEEVRFRFRLATDRSVGREGWYIDDVKVEACTPAADYAALLEPAESVVDAAPGSVITHTFMLRNVGQLDDSYALAVSGASWPTSLEVGTPVAVDSGANAVVPVTVEVPDTPWATDTFTLTATSVNSPTVMVDSAGTTTAVVNPGMELSGDMFDVGDSGETMTYTVTITNVGDYPDTFSVSLEEHSWITWASDADTGPLAPGEAMSLEVYVTIGAGTSDSVVVRFTSILDADVTETLTITTYAWQYRYLPAIVRQP